MPPRLPFGEFGCAEERLQFILEFAIGANEAADRGRIALGDVDTGDRVILPSDRQEREA